MGKDDYIDAAELAKKYDVSMHTIRRRINDKKLFPNAKKEQMSFGERWRIPLKEAEAVTLKDISEKIYYARNQNKIDLILDNERVSPEAYERLIKDLEKRVSVLERLCLKLSEHQLV